jgi:hypothetical protein
MAVFGVLIVVPALVLIWRIDPFRMRRSVALLGQPRSFAITVWALAVPEEPWEQSRHQSRLDLRSPGDHGLRTDDQRMD